MSIQRPARPFNFAATITSTTGGVSADELFTVPNNHFCEITFILIENGGASNQDITIEVYDNSNTNYYNLTNSLTIPTKSVSKLVESSRLFLDEGDKVVASVDGGSVDMVISGLIYKGLS